MMKITEETKIKIFAMKSMARMYAQTDEDFGRFCRGFHNGIVMMMGALGLEDMLPAECPDDEGTSYASFCAVYGTYLNAERKPRLDCNNEDYKMMYGEAAQAMMQETEQHLKEYKKRKAKKGMEH